MGLFDDILKKPQEKAPVDPLMQSSGSTPPPGSGTGSSGGQPPQDYGSQPIVAPIFIEKTAESSLFGSPAEAPVDMADLRIQEAMPVVLPHAEENTGALLVTTVTESPVEITTPTPVVSPEILPELTATDSLFSLDQKEAPSESGFLSDTRDIAEEKKVEKILHPKEFLERSIENIDSMIADIDTAYDQKVSEAEGYAHEKDRLASLEKDTYTEAADLNEEKEHALHVRKLLDKELGGPKKKPAPEKSTPESLTESIEVPDAPLESSLPLSDVLPASSIESTLLDLTKEDAPSIETDTVKKEETVAV